MKQSTRTIIAATATLLVQVLVVSADARAQSATPAPATAVQAKQFVGTWEGKFASGHGSDSPMMLVIEPDGDAKVKVKQMAMQMAEGQMQDFPVSKPVLTSSDLTWTIEAMGAQCEVTAILQQGVLKGSTVCGHGQMQFSLTRKEVAKH